MASTRGTESRFDYVDWFSGAPERPKEPTPEATEFVKYLWPVSEEYHSVLNPVFLTSLKKVEELNARPVWLVRDGIIPLLWFFKTHPKPGRLRSKILLWEEHLAYVPHAWKKHIGAYRIESAEKSPGVPRALLLTGIVMDTFCPISLLEQRLEELASSLGSKALKSLRVMSFLPTRHDGFGMEYRHDFHSRFVISLCRALGTSIEPITWPEFRALDDLRGFLHLELSDGNLCSDSYLTHAALSRGAVPALAARKYLKDAGSEWVALSPLHGARVWFTVPVGSRREGVRALEESTREAYLSALQRLMTSEAHIRLPWPRWFNAVKVQG